MYFETRPFIKCLKANISIQASSTHYSTPRSYLPNIQDYQEVEIALFDKDDEWINPHESDILSEFPALQELLNHYENDTCPVGAYVPINIVNALVDYLNEN